MNKPVRVLIVDEQGATRQGLKALLALCPDILVIGEATNSRQALEFMATVQPDVVLLDMPMLGFDGVDTIRLFKLRQPRAKIVVLTSSATQRGEALSAGADRFVLKGEAFEVLDSAIVG